MKILTNDSQVDLSNPQPNVVINAPLIPAVTPQPVIIPNQGVALVIAAHVNTGLSKSDITVTFQRRPVIDG